VQNNLPGLAALPWRIGLPFVVYTLLVLFERNRWIQFFVVHQLLQFVFKNRISVIEHMQDHVMEHANRLGTRVIILQAINFSGGLSHPAFP
jgi:hypothetical protein